MCKGLLCRIHVIPSDPFALARNKVPVKSLVVVKFESTLRLEFRTKARPKIERVSRGIIKSLISMNTGISLVHESDIGANLADLVYRELRDGAGASRFEFSACWRADNENPALQEFLKLLSEGYSSPSIGR